MISHLTRRRVNMHITKHAIKRYQERVTPASYDVIYNFIRVDIDSSVLLYSINGIEKWKSKDIVYVVDSSKNKAVLTLYLCNF